MEREVKKTEELVRDTMELAPGADPLRHGTVLPKPSLSLFEGAGVTLRFVGMSLLYFVLAVTSNKILPLQLVFSYASANLLVIAALIYNRKYAHIIGKNKATGQIPLWSWVVFWPFHATNRLFALVARVHHGVGPATEVYPNFYVGGWYSYTLNIRWKAVVDLTCELPERCITEEYMNCPQWDGVVALEDVDKAAKLLARAAQEGPVLCHCAHGAGRSTTIMRAALVEAGHFEDVDAAFVHIHSKREVCRTNKHFQQVLEAWQKAR